MLEGRPRLRPELAGRSHDREKTGGYAGLAALSRPHV